MGLNYKLNTKKLFFLIKYYWQLDVQITSESKALKHTIKL